MIVYAAADPNAAAYGGATPCSASAAGGHVDALKVIISGGCDTARRTGGGYTAVEHALMNGHSEAVKILSGEGGVGGETGAEAARGVGGDGPKGTLDVLIPQDSPHPGAGSFTVDGGLLADDEQRLFALFRQLVDEQLPRGDGADAGSSGGLVAMAGGGVLVDDAEAAAERGESERTIGVERVYVCDAEGWIRRIVARAISSSGAEVPFSNRLSNPGIRV